MCCWSVFSGGGPAAMRSNHISFQLPLPDTLQPAEIGFCFLKLPVFSLSQGIFLFLGFICSPDQQWTVQHHKCLVPYLGQHGYQVPYQVLWRTTVNVLRSGPSKTVWMACLLPTSLRVCCPSSIDSQALIEPTLLQDKIPKSVRK